MRKAFKTIDKLKLGKRQAECLSPIWSLLSSVRASEDSRNYIVRFCDGILLPNENEVTELLSLQRTALKLTLTCLRA